MKFIIRVISLICLLLYNTDVAIIIGRIQAAGKEFVSVCVILIATCKRDKNVRLCCQVYEIIALSGTCDGYMVDDDEQVSLLQTFTVSFSADISTTDDFVIQQLYTATVTVVLLL